MAFVDRGNADTYYETLKVIKRAIQNKIRGTLSSGILFLHDNV